MTAAPAAAPRTFKVAFFNIQSGKGEPAMPGVVSPFTDTANCTDTSRPLNAWGHGLVQRELTTRVGNDTAVVALGLTEAWACGKPSAVKNVLGWKAASTERNGTAIVARYGFSGPEQWLQLDTTRNLNPKDTMWLLRVPICLDSQCTRSVTVFTVHWYGSGLLPLDVESVFETQSQQTIDFMSAVPAGQPHILLGDLNAFDGNEVLCAQAPRTKPLHMLRDAGYVDAWPAIHGPAEGNTGMWNRTACGTPAGNLFKRIDYTWSKGTNPLSMA
ncbi:MAG TPA: endonuclease/exonuclease/phosphatase family protein, partial [Burkholderiales bacterium]|nr:endonuclease/exonuclease/phosphatase family protein [Burkholderiales bacterium]